jgi:RNA recognition motif-containing protein
MATNTVAKTNSSSMSVDQRVQPNQSLYIQNLPEKLQKPDLKRSLYMLFSTFGPVLDAVRRMCFSGMSMRRHRQCEPVKDSSSTAEKW